MEGFGTEPDMPCDEEVSYSPSLSLLKVVMREATEPETWEDEPSAVS